MKVKTAEITSLALNFAVAKCERGLCPRISDGLILSDTVGYALYFSSDWAQGGPIIEREKIGCWCDDRTGVWGANKQGIPYQQFGPTPLVAAMRCYVASKLGEEVEIPEELL